MAWTPTAAGPRTRREHFYHWWRQLTSLGAIVGGESGTSPPDAPPDPDPQHQHWLANLSDTDVTSGGPGAQSVDAAQRESLVYNRTTGYWIPEPRSRVFFQATEPDANESKPGDFWFASGYE